MCEDIAEQKVLLGFQLSDEQEKTLLRFLFNNKDVFAWTANDLCGVIYQVNYGGLISDIRIRAALLKALYDSLWREDQPLPVAKIQANTALSSMVIAKKGYTPIEQYHTDGNQYTE